MLYVRWLVIPVVATSSASTFASVSQALMEFTARTVSVCTLLYSFAKRCKCFCITDVFGRLILDVIVLFNACNEWVLKRSGYWYSSTNIWLQYDRLTSVMRSQFVCVIWHTKMETAAVSNGDQTNSCHPIHTSLRPGWFNQGQPERTVGTCACAPPTALQPCTQRQMATVCTRKLQSNSDQVCI